MRRLVWFTPTGNGLERLVRDWHLLALPLPISLVTTGPMVHLFDLSFATNTVHLSSYAGCLKEIQFDLITSSLLGLWDRLMMIRGMSSPPRSKLCTLWISPYQLSGRRFARNSRNTATWANCQSSMCYCIRAMQSSRSVQTYFWMNWEQDQTSWIDS